MSDKDFKVKNKLILNGLAGNAGPLIASASNVVDSTPYLPTQYGGTGTSTSPNAGQVLYSTSGSTYAPTNFSSLLSQSVLTKTDLAYTLNSSENNSVILADNFDHQTYYIPKDATDNFPIGSEIRIIQAGQGRVDVVAEDSLITTVLVKGEQSVGASTTGKNSYISCIKLASDRWSIINGKAKRFISIGKGPVSSSKNYTFDGKQWYGSEQVLRSLSGTPNITAIMTDGTKYIAVANSSTTIYTSTDLITWTASSLPSSASWTCGIYAGGKYVIASNGGVALYSTDGITWSTGSGLGSTNNNNIAYGNGVYVIAGGSGSTMYYSSNGITWSSTTVPVSINAYGLVFANGLFTTTGDFNTLVAFSTNGVVWTTATTPTAQMPSTSSWNVAGYGTPSSSPMWVSLVSGSTIAASSTNGVTWTTRTSSSSLAWTAITYGASGFAAIANSSGLNSIQTSTDGITWTTRTSQISGGWKSIVYNAGTYMALPASGVYYLKSTDCVTWNASASTIASLPASTTYYDSAYGAGKHLAVSYSTAAALSTDGITWTATTLPGSLSQPSVAFGNSLFYVIGDSTSNAYSSTDGITWTTRTTPAASTWRALTYGASGWSALSNNAALSTDLITWSYVGSFGQASAVAYGNSTYVAVQSGSVTGGSSTNGTTWTARTLPTASSWTAIEYGSAKFVAIASGTTAAASSTDGITWTARTMPVSTNWSAIKWNGSAFVAISSTSSTNIAAYSTDGITWTQTTLPISGQWFGLSATTGKFVATSYNSNSVVYSTDGLTWKVSESPTNIMPSSGIWNQVVYGGGKYFAIDNTYRADAKSAAISTDGTTWTLSTLSTGSWQWVSNGYSGGNYIAINSANGIINYSTDTVTWTAVTGTSWSLTASFSKPDLTVSIWGQNTFQSSTNGVTWTVRTIPPATGQWNAWAHDGNKFITIRQNSDQVYFTTDAVTWTAATTPTASMPSSQAWRDVAYGNTRYVSVVNSSSIAAYSTDGVSWTTSTLPISASWQQVEHNGNIFLTVGSGVAATSTDGATWTQRVAPTTTSILKIIANGTNFIMTGYNDGKTYITTDGVSWLYTNSQKEFINTIPVNNTLGSFNNIIPQKDSLDYADAIANDDSLVLLSNAASNTQFGATSIEKNNSLYTALSFPTAETFESTSSSRYGDYAFNKFYYIKSNTAIVSYSVDGVSWNQEVLLPTTANWSDLKYGLNGLIGISYSSNIGVISTDGNSWTQITMPASSTWKKLTYGKNKYVAISENSSIAAYSTDGTNWTQSTMPSASAWSSVKYGKGIFVSIAANSTTAASSTDGIVWTARTMPSSSNWVDVEFGNGIFTAICKNSTNAAYSTDGVTWTSSTNKSGYGNTVVFL